jgi:sirohydrochlorin cobaltochelatase
LDALDRGGGAQPAFPPAVFCCLQLAGEVSVSAGAGQQGVLLFAHGARDPRWADPFEAVARQVRALRPSVQVELAFLEFMPPTLPEAARMLAERGCQRVNIVPLFLGAGGHVRKDIPALLDELRREHSSVQWTLQPAIGEAESVITAMARTAASCIDGQ